MSGSSARQAELEALRNRGIAQNNAERLASASMPTINVDWQAQQKALREKERQRKAEAASQLNQFRGAGVTSEQAKLMALRKEERQRVLDAQAKLRSYKADMNDVRKGMTLSAKKETQKGASARRLVVQAGDVSVGELAERFQVGEEQDRGPLIGEGKTWTNPTTQDDDSKQLADSMVMVDKPESSVPMSLEPALSAVGSTVPISLEPVPSAVGSVDHSAAAAIVPDHSQDEGWEKTPSLLPQEPSVSPDGWENVKHEDAIGSQIQNEPAGESFSSPQTQAEVAEITPSVPEPTQTQVEVVETAPSVSEPTQLDVEFYFSLLTTSVNPDVASYMTKVFAATNDSISGSGLMLDSSPLPYVRNVEQDFSYFDTKGRQAKKFTVYATLPVLVPREGSIEEARRIILSILREAVQAGSLNVD